MSQRNYRNSNKKDSIKNEVILSESDKNLFIVVCFLVVIGIMAIFSATAQSSIAAGNNPLSFVMRQSAFLIMGIVGLFFFRNYDYKKLGKYSLSFAWIVIFLLILTHFTGENINGATRWIRLGFFQFQPSEMAKISVILLLSNAFYKDFKLLDERKLKYYIPILIMLFLIKMQPNLSMVILLTSTALVMYCSAGISFKNILSVCLKPGCIGITVGIFALIGVISVIKNYIMSSGASILNIFMKPYQMTRIKVWLNPESDPSGSGYNILQSLYAFAAGGFFGVGYGNSRQKFWLPERHTDFIFAFIAEEFGFLGCLLIIGLFLTFVHRGLVISSRVPDMFGKLLALGITFSIGFQAFINISVSSALVPATGIPLPLISYGGTSLVVTLCMVGILLNISRKRIKRINLYERNFSR